MNRSLGGRRTCGASASTIRKTLRAHPWLHGTTRHLWSVRLFLVVSLLALSFLSLAPQAAATEVETNCPGPRTGDKKATGDQWTYEKNNIYGLGCLNVKVSAARATSAAQAASAAEDDSKLYAFRVTSKIAPGPWGIPHRQYFRFDITLGGTAKEGIDYKFVYSRSNQRGSPLLHSSDSTYAGHLYDSSKVWVLPGKPRGVVTSAYIFQILDDDKVEPDETVTFAISYRRPGGGGEAEYQIGTASATFTIRNDDVAPTPQRPRVSIEPGKSSIKEGAPATFTVTATPAPAADLTVAVTVSESAGSDFVASDKEGATTVTIPANQTQATLTVATTGDTVDEPDGSVTATLGAGTSYTVSSVSSSGTVSILDDDVPKVAITAQAASVTEGAPATFTLSAAPKPKASITVKVDLGQSGNFAQSGEIRLWSVTIGTGGTASLRIKTVDDSTDEEDGIITARILGRGQSYSVSPTDHAASVTVLDNDGPPSSTDATSPLPTVDVLGSFDDEPNPNRGALLAIYNMSGGRKWTRKDNWNTRAPVTIWYGVVADQDSRITGLVLEDNGLEGGIHEDIGELDKLEVLYMNNNKLEGVIPLAQLRGLESLEELALWGNNGLTGTIPDDLGKRVDRAVLRKIKEVNGVSVLADWFTGDEAVFDYSGWSRVEVTGNGRVRGLDLSGVGLSGDITEAVWELSALEYLDLSDNPGLSGEVPPTVMYGELEFLDISGSGVCVPRDEEFGQWLDSMDFTDSDNCGEDQTETLSASEPAQGGGGGCSVASGNGFKRSVPEIVLAVLAFAAVAWGRRKN